MYLSKKQVKAFLEVMSSDEARPALCEASISERNNELFLVATDCYCLSALKLTETSADLIGKVVTRAALIKWYKLAAHKDYFTEVSLGEVLTDSDSTFPEWQKLMPNEDNRVAHSTLALNPEYWVILNTLAGKILTLEAYQNYIFSATNDSGIYLLCGLKTSGYSPILMSDHEQLTAREL